MAEAGAEAYIAALRPAKVTILPGTWLDQPKRYFEQPLLIALVYLLRALRTHRLVRSLPATDVVYTPGDFLCDVVAAALKRKRQPRVTWAAAIFHVNEPPHRRRGN